MALVLSLSFLICDFSPTALCALFEFTVQQCNRLTAAFLTVLYKFQVFFFFFSTIYTVYIIFMSAFLQ